MHLFSLCPSLIVVSLRLVSFPISAEMLLDLVLYIFQLYPSLIFVSLHFVALSRDRLEWEIKTREYLFKEHQEITWFGDVPTCTGQQQ